MKGIIISLALALAIAVAGFLLIHVRNQRGNSRPPAKAVPASFTDSNGNEFTVYVGGVIVNGTNVVVTNLNFKVGPAGSGKIVQLQTNQVPK